MTVSENGGWAELWPSNEKMMMINQWIEWDTIFSDCPKWLIFGQGTWAENHGRIKLERPQKQCD